MTEQGSRPTQLLIVLSNAVPGQDGEYNDWYSGRHLVDVLTLDGFKAAQRFELVPTETASPSQHKYLAVYELSEGELERAETALVESRVERAEALAAGREPQVTMSPAIEQESLVVWWASSISERMERDVKT